MANVITLIRIGLAISLLFIRKYSPLFLILYSICGFTDVLDGYIARKTRTESKFGAKLDTIADLLFFIVMFIIMFDILLKDIIFIVFIIIILLIRIASVIIVLKKYNKFAILHTYTNKITGLLLFFIPYFIYLNNANIIVYIIGVIALISSIEELTINIKSKQLDLNKKSIFN
ncbi:MAG: CDP-alcohol phosphatidyltransferase family protein [Anaeroplasma sp.]